jgi:hypothetical protein
MAGRAMLGPASPASAGPAHGVGRARQASHGSARSGLAGFGKAGRRMTRQAWAALIRRGNDWPDMTKARQACVVDRGRARHGLGRGGAASSGRQARTDKAGRCQRWRAETWPAKARHGRHGRAGQVLARSGAEGEGMGRAVRAGHGEARRGRHDGLGKAVLCIAWLGGHWQGKAGTAGHDMAEPNSVRRDLHWPAKGTAGMEGHGGGWHGLARCGTAGHRRDGARQARRGMTTARPGEIRRGVLAPGRARTGATRQARHCPHWQVEQWRGVV